jgi:hypothetical protein
MPGFLLRQNQVAFAVGLVPCRSQNTMHLAVMMTFQTYFGGLTEGAVGMFRFLDMRSQQNYVVMAGVDQRTPQSLSLGSEQRLHHN